MERIDQPENARSRVARGGAMVVAESGRPHPVALARAPMAPEVATLFSLLMREMDRLRDRAEPLSTEERNGA